MSRSLKLLSGAGQQMLEVVQWAKYPFLRVLLALLLAALPVIFATGSPVMAQAVTVTVDAPAQVSAGSTFTVPVNITPVVDFDAAVVRVRFDPAILSLTDVTDGNIGGTIIPIAALVEKESGLWGITANVPGFPGVTGEGYLIEFHFYALAPGNSDIGLEHHSLSNKGAQLIPATWVDDSVNVIAGANPTIAFDPTTFSFTAIKDGANPSNQTLNVWNSGGGTLNWSVSDDGAWLSLAPASGDSTGEYDTVTLSVNISGLTAGDYNAVITITAPGATNTPWTVPVSLTMTPDGGGGGGGGGPAPAAFSVSDLSIQPAEVQPNEIVTITVSVANTGGTEGSYSVVLNINGAKEAEKSVTIAAGSSQDVSFSVTREDAGSYSVSVAGLSRSFTVVAPEPEEEEEEEEEEEVEEEEEEEEEEARTEPHHWPLIGGIIGAVTAIALVIIFRRKVRLVLEILFPRLPGG